MAGRGDPYYRSSESTFVYLTKEKEKQQKKQCSVWLIQLQTTSAFWQINSFNCACWTLSEDEEKKRVYITLNVLMIWCEVSPSWSSGWLEHHYWLASQKWFKTLWVACMCDRNDPFQRINLDSSPVLLEVVWSLKVPLGLDIASALSWFLLTLFFHL